jgi:hypothetical protein
MHECDNLQALTQDVQTLRVSLVKLIQHVDACGRDSQTLQRPNSSSKELFT